jgi:murein DD-endopeptidase MepM/ murein hydrolase activator NlpD
VTRLLIIFGVAVILGSCSTREIPEAEAVGEIGNIDAYLFGAPGRLSPSNSGTGRTGDHYIYAPSIRFPLEKAPAYINSQVYGVGGLHGPKGKGQCDARNYQYPWKDNYCEKRSWKMPLCPGGKGHQGVDIRPASCNKDQHLAVAVEEGTITAVGRYTVYLRGKNTGTTYRYLHLNATRLAVHIGQKVARGQRLGVVSNNMGKAKTTIHLHFDMKQTLRFSDGSSAKVFVPPYSSLVDAYQRLLSGRN